MARLACRTGAVCPGPRPHTESGEQARAHGERRGDGDQARAGAVYQAEGARRGGSYSRQYAAVPLIRASRVRATSLLTLCVACVRRLRGSIRAEAWAAARRQIPKSIMADQPDEPESQQGRHGAQVLRVLTQSE